MTTSAAFSTYYDQITLHLHPQSTMDLELALIQSRVAPGAAVLDIGCGTGRHLIPLNSLGYRVVGVEPNAEMRKVLIEKDSAAQIVASDFLQLTPADLPETSFDLAICMWNSICEICHTENDLKAFAEKLKTILKPGGKLLVHLDLPTDLGKYTVSVVTDEFEYTSEVKEITGNTTRSEETLSVVETKFTQDLTQTWWEQMDLEQAWNGILKFESGGPLARRSGLYLWFSR